jgi:hypothetical protein
VRGYGVILGGTGWGIPGTGSGNTSGGGTGGISGGGTGLMSGGGVSMMSGTPVGWGLLGCSIMP